MVATIGSLRVTLTAHTPSIEACFECLASLRRHLADSLCDGVHVGIELSEIDFNDLATFVTSDLVVSLEPTERCLDLVAAVAARNFDGGSDVVEYRHGWPILSVVGRTPTVAEAGGEAIAPGGGQIA